MAIQRRLAALTLHADAEPSLAATGPGVNSRHRSPRAYLPLTRCTHGRQMPPIIRLRQGYEPRIPNGVGRATSQLASSPIDCPTRPGTVAVARTDHASPSLVVLAGSLSLSAPLASIGATESRNRWNRFSPTAFASSPGGGARRRRSADGGEPVEAVADNEALVVCVVHGAGDAIELCADTVLGLRRRSPVHIRVRHLQQQVGSRPLCLSSTNR
jgi:hypothetical protein